MIRPTRPLRRLIDRASDRVVRGVGLAELRALEERLGRLEEAAAENASLALPLERYLSRLEADLVPLLESAVPDPHRQE